MDTEGFNGVGQQTSMTYEANLFGLTFLLSSVLIFNSIFPVDAGTIRMIEGHCRHALLVLQELKDAKVPYNQNSRPSFLWAVQNFNLFNLKNSNLSEDELMLMLQATSKTTFGDMKQAQAIFGNEGPNQQMLNMLFKNVQLLPVRRPHKSDEVVANLNAHATHELSEEYISDTKRVRTAAFSSLELETIKSGPEFASQIEQWVLHGHIVLETSSNGKEAINVSS